MKTNQTAVAIRTPLADTMFGSVLEAEEAYEGHLVEIKNKLPAEVKRSNAIIDSAANRKFLVKAGFIGVGALLVGFVVLEILSLLLAAGAAAVVFGGIYWWWKFKLPGQIARAQTARAQELQRNYSEYVEAAQREKNRHLAALKSEARQNPIEQLQVYLQSKERQLTDYQGFVTQVGAQVKSAGDMLADRKRLKPGRDYKKKDEALAAMNTAYQFHLDKSELGRQALKALKEAVDDAKFDYQFGQVGQAAMQQMQALEGQDLLNEMLAAESFASVRDNFNLVFSEIEVQIGSINSAKQIDFGEGVTLDVSNIHIPTTTKAK